MSPDLANSCSYAKVQIQDNHSAFLSDDWIKMQSLFGTWTCTQEGEKDNTHKHHSPKWHQERFRFLPGPSASAARMCSAIHSCGYLSGGGCLLLEISQSCKGGIHSHVVTMWSLEFKDRTHSQARTRSNGAGWVGGWKLAGETGTNKETQPGHVPTL